MTQRIHHVGITAEFAVGGRGLAGLVATNDYGKLDVGGTATRLLAGPNAYLACELNPSPTSRRVERAVNAIGIAHLCVQARDGQWARETLEAGDVSFISSPVALGTGFLYSYGYDPAGRLIELESAPFLPAEPPAWFGHLAFVSKDAERLAAFYGQLLEAPISGGRFRENPLLDRVAGLAGVDVEARWVRSAPLALEFWQYNSPLPGPDGEDVGRYAYVGLEAVAIGTSADAIRQLGGETDHLIEEGADGRSMWARDPDGNRIRLIELKSARHGLAALPQADVLARAAAQRPGA